MGLYHTFKAFAGFKVIDIPFEKFTMEVGCKEHGKHCFNYCGKCGKPSANFKNSVQEPISMYDLFEDDIFSFHHQEGFTLISSNRRESNSCINLEPNELLSLTPEIIEQKVDDFKNYHKSSIEKVAELTKQEIVVEFFVMDIYD